jgi:hypothetical protein
MKFGVSRARTRKARPPFASSATHTHHRPIIPPRAQKELQAAVMEKPEWSHHYLDYKALKQILAELTGPEETQTEDSAQVSMPPFTPLRRLPLPPPRHPASSALQSACGAS